MVSFEGLKVSLKQLVGSSVAASLSILCVFVFLVHVVFQIEFNCTCTHEEMLHCWTYMILPAVLICLITLWADKRFRRLYGFTCNSCKYSWKTDSKRRCHFLRKLFILVLKAAFSGLVWVVSLLLDGDWYACCYSLPADQMYPCKGKDILSLDEKKALVHQKNKSMLLGFGILGVMLVAIILSTCRSGCKCCNSACLCSNHYLDEFEENLLEEVDIFFAKGLKNISKVYITEKIHDNNLQVLQYEPDASRTSGAASGTSEASLRAHLVENVKRIDWEKLSKFSFQVIDDFKAAMNENSPINPPMTVSRGTAVIDTPEAMPLQGTVLK